MKHKKTILLSTGLIVLLLVALRHLNREPDQPEALPVGQSKPASEHIKKMRIAEVYPDTDFREETQDEEEEQEWLPVAKIETEGGSGPTNEVLDFLEEQMMENQMAWREWTRENMDDAMAWLASAPEGPERDAVAETVCAQTAEFDPEQAVALAESYGGICSNLVGSFVMQWAEQDKEAAYVYATGKPPGAERDRLLGRVAFVRAQDDPREAATIVAEEMSPGPNQDEAAISVLYQWLQVDTNAAMEWVQMFPDGSLRDRAIQEVENMTTSGALKVDVGF